MCRNWWPHSVDQWVFWLMVNSSFGWVYCCWWCGDHLPSKEKNILNFVFLKPLPTYMPISALICRKAFPESLSEGSTIDNLAISLVLWFMITITRCKIWEFEYSNHVHKKIIDVTKKETFLKLKEAHIDLYKSYKSYWLNYIVL